MRHWHSGEVILNVAVFAGAAFLILTFGYAAVRGPNGLAAQSNYQARSDILRTELANVKLYRNALENRVLRLSDSYLDLDLLDEQARRRLVVIRPDEQILR